MPALFAVIGLLSAVHRARRDGVGGFVDVSMYDAMLAMCERAVYQHSYTGDVPTRQGNSHPLLCPFDVVPAADGWVSIAAPGNKHWQQLCAVIGRPELATDERTRDNVSRLVNRDFTMSAVTAWTTTRTKDQIVETLGGKVPVAPVNTVEDIYADPHVRARNMLVEVDHPGVPHPVTIANSPIKFADAPSTHVRRAPLLGEHTDEVLAQFDNATAALQLEETR